MLFSSIIIKMKIIKNKKIYDQLTKKCFFCTTVELFSMKILQGIELLNEFNTFF